MQSEYKEGKWYDTKKHTKKKVGTKALTLLDYFIFGLPENKETQSCSCSHLRLNPLCLSPTDEKKTQVIKILYFKT